LKSLPLLILGLIAGCGKESAKVHDKLYFDLKGYIRSEIARVAALDTCVTKAVVIGDSSETKTFDHADTTFWKQELSLFIAADINAAAYRDLYSVQRELVGEDSVITFTATADKVPTRLLKVWKNNGQVLRIEAVQRTTTSVYSTEHRMEYVAGSGYNIQSVQETRGAPTRHFVIKGTLGCQPNPIPAD
jgi:hypothetical protein